MIVNFYNYMINYYYFYIILRIRGRYFDVFLVNSKDQRNNYKSC